MHIVIDIPKKKYDLIVNGEYCGILDKDLYAAIKNGTPLPKGHGRLIDADSLLLEISELKQSPWFDENINSSHIVREDAVGMVEDLCIKGAPTVMEADAEVYTAPDVAVEEIMNEGKESEDADYEGKQKADDEIKVGDEVKSNKNVGVVLTDIPCTTANVVSVLFANGIYKTAQLVPIKSLKKTGRHFDQIEEVLKQMQEG